MFSNYHTHTTWCDGADSPEELVREALRLGCPEIGLSGHSHLPVDSCTMTEEGTLAYCEEIRSLQSRYADRIRIRLGIEQDIFSEIDRSLFEYVIGAVHYLKNEAGYAVDESRGNFLRLVREEYGGDFYALAEEYFALEATVYERTGCDIIAHFDLITKYNEGNALFDTGHPRYVAAANAALDRLLGTGAILEVNTGAIARGYRTAPYPEPRLIRRWTDGGGKLILSADCHDKRCLLLGFEELAELPNRMRTLEC